MAKAPTKGQKDRCKMALRKVVPDHVSDQYIDHLVEQIGELKSREAAKGVKGNFRKAVGELVSESRMALAKQRQERAMNLLKARDREAFYRQYDQGDKGKLRGMKLAEGLLSQLSGGQQLIKGANDSVYARAAALAHDYASKAYIGIAEKGHWDLFTSNAIEKEIMMEMHEIGKEGGKPGISGNKEAKEIADVLAAVQRQRLEDMRNAGADLGDIKNRIMPQVWDPKKANDAGFEAWAKTIEPMLDHERTFGLGAANPEYRSEFLQEAFKGITEGRFADGDQSMIQTSDELITTANYAKLGNQINQSRALHFKDGASFYEFNQQFGAQSLNVAIGREIRSNAKNASMINAFGTNPEAAIQADKVRVRRMLKGDDDAIKAFDSKMKAVDNLYAEVSGALNRPADETLAKWGANGRSMVQLGSLGGTMLRSLPDVANGIAITSSATGEGLGHTAVSWASSFFQAQSRADREAIGQLIGFAHKDHFAEIAHITGADAIGQQPGTMAKMNALFFKAIGLEHWTETTRTATPMVLAREGAMLSDRQWSELPAQYRANMERYNFGEADWKALSRTVVDLPDGSKVLSPAMLREMNPGADAKFLRETEIKWRTYLQENADFSAPNPNARVRARITQGTERGTWAGETARFVGQFKAFGMFGYDIGLRILGSNPEKPLFYYRDVLKGQGDFQRMAGFIVGATTMAYVGDCALSISKNQKPPDPSDPWTWKRALQLSGAAGLYGDILLGEAQRLQQGGLVSQLAGPMASKVGDAAGIASAMIAHGADAWSKGEPIMEATKKDQLKGFDFLVRSTPGNNIFYLKSALDYMILDRMRNGIDPDYTMNKQDRQMKNNKSPLIDF
jgi:hypothetical protein